MVSWGSNPGLQCISLLYYLWSCSPYCSLLVCSSIGPIIPPAYSSVQSHPSAPQPVCPIIFPIHTSVQSHSLSYCLLSYLSGTHPFRQLVSTPPQAPSWCPALWHAHSAAQASPLQFLFHLALVQGPFTQDGRRVQFDLATVGLRGEMELSVVMVPGSGPGWP